MAHPEESPDFVPPEWVHQSLDCDREHIRVITQRAEENARRVYPGYQFEGMPHYLTDADVLAWEARGLVCRYIPKCRLPPACIGALDVRFSPDSVLEMQRLAETGQGDPYRLSDGWYLIEAEPRSVADIDAERSVDRDTTEWLMQIPALYQLLYDRHEIPAIARKLTSNARLLKAIDFLFLLNSESSVEIADDDIQVEVCADWWREPTKLHVVGYSDDTLWLDRRDTKEPFAGGIRRVWKMPQVLGLRPRLV